MNVGDNLKLFRNKKNLTQQELGELLGVKKSTISRWESGERSMTIENVKKISHILEIPVGAFLSSNDSYESTKDWDRGSFSDNNRSDKVVPKDSNSTNRSFEVVREDKEEFVTDATRPSLPMIDDPDIIQAFEGFKEFNKLTPEDQEDIKNILKLAVKIIEKRKVPDV
jgi:transcriptional regulator with XRE-family HTH domain